MKFEDIKVGQKVRFEMNVAPRDGVVKKVFKQFAKVELCGSSETISIFRDWVRFVDLIEEVK